MLFEVNPMLPMRNKEITKVFYTLQLDFIDIGKMDFEHYLILQKDKVQLHFFTHNELDPKQNYGQVYIRTDNVDEIYQSFMTKGIQIHPNGFLQNKPWQQREFSILDPDHNLIIFGQSI